MRRTAKHDRVGEVVKFASKNKVNAPVCVGLTVYDCDKTKIGDKLYLTGLAYAYSEKSIDNIAILKKNMEQEYALDYLDKPFFPEISPDLIRIVNGNYIVPMLKLFEHYRVAGDANKAAWLKKKLLVIVKDTDYEDDIKLKTSSVY
jgi:hypothetical protein